MAKKKPERVVINYVAGLHPVLKNLHQLTHFEDDGVLIIRDSYVTRNPVTDKTEVTEFVVVDEKFKDHQWLWYSISKNHIPLRERITIYPDKFTFKQKKNALAQNQNFVLRLRYQENL